MDTQVIDARIAYVLATVMEMVSVTKIPLVQAFCDQIPTCFHCQVTARYASIHRNATVTPAIGANNVSLIRVLNSVKMMGCVLLKAVETDANAETIIPVTGASTSAARTIVTNHAQRFLVKMEVFAM